jgi:hypothetical protein
MQMRLWAPRVPLLVLCLLATGSGLAYARAGRIDSVSPTSGSTGQVVTITGNGFGAGNVRITIGGVAVQLLSATGRSATFRVPAGLPPGPTTIVATNPGGHTGSIAFRVTGPAPPLNTAPIVNAGPDQEITLPNTATLNGVVTDDGLPTGSPLTITWSKVSGPGSVIFSTPNAAVSTAAFSSPGSYVLRLTASDTEFSVSDDIVVTVTVPSPPRLTVQIAGDVANSFVLFDPSTGHACNGTPGSQCTFTYAPGDTVRLYTQEFGGFTRASNFLSWSGVPGCGTGDDCVITFGTADVTVTATFTIRVFVAVEGTGAGRVTTSPAGIDCTSGTSCGPLSLTPGQAVTFTAAPNAGSVVDRWDTYNTNAVDAAAIAACGSATTCTITPTGFLHVRVVWGVDPGFAKSFDVSVSGGGSGFVSSNFGLYCPAVGCSVSTPVAPGTYQLYASPNDGSYFAGWGGDAASCGRNTVCDVTVGGSPVNVTASFEPGTRLTVQVAGYAGNSFILFDPSSGHACNGTPGSLCTFTYAPGDTVRLYTREFNGFTRASNFLSWSGVPDCGTDDDCVITFGTDDVTVTATFTIPVFVAVEGSGAGRVTTLPLGIDCTNGTFCGPLALTPGQAVTFTAAPAVGSAVDRWDTYNTNAVDAAVIAACGNATTCTIAPTGYLHVRVVWGPAINQAPVVNAGPDQTIMLPAMATLTGSVNDDGLPLGSPVTLGWSKVSGPGAVLFTSPNNAITSASFSLPGSYVLRLTANDTAATVSDDVTVTVQMESCSVSTTNFGDLGALAGGANFDPAEDALTFYAPLEPTAPADSIQIDLYAGYGVFSAGSITPGTFQITGEELNFATCGLCVRLFTNVTSTGDVGDTYMATGGTVTIAAAGTANGSTLSGSLSNVQFRHVNIDPVTGNTTLAANSCSTALTNATFSATVTIVSP